MSQAFFPKVESVVKAIKPDVGEVRYDSRLNQDLGFDSIYIVDLFFELEQKLDVELNIADFYKTVRAEGHSSDILISDICKYLSELAQQ